MWRNTQTGDVTLWYMDGLMQDGTATITYGASLDWKIIGTPDLNWDDKPDILWYNTTTGAVSCWIMDGTAYVTGYAIHAGVPLNWKPVGNP